MATATCCHFRCIIHGTDIKGAQGQDAEGPAGAPVCLRGCCSARRKGGWEGARVGTPSQSGSTHTEFWRDMVAATAELGAHGTHQTERLRKGC